MKAKNNGGKLTWTVLSISLLTVMAGAAIAPALGIIRDHFAGAPDMLVQLIVSLPALFIIVTNLLFPWLCGLMKTRTAATMPWMNSLPGLNRLQNKPSRMESRQSLRGC